MKKILIKLKVLNFFKLELLLIILAILTLIFNSIKSTTKGIVDIQQTQNKITNINNDINIINDNLTKTFLYDDAILKNVILNKEKDTLIENVEELLSNIKNKLDSNIVDHKVVDSIFDDKIVVLKSISKLKTDFNIRNFYLIDTLQLKSITYTKTLFRKYKDIKIDTIEYEKLNKIYLRSYIDNYNRNNQRYVNYITENTESNIEIKNLILNHNYILLEKNKLTINTLLNLNNDRYYQLITNIIIYSSIILLCVILLINDIKKFIRNNNRKESTIQDLINYFKSKNSF